MLPASGAWQLNARWPSGERPEHFAYESKLVEAQPEPAFGLG